MPDESCSAMCYDCWWRPIQPCQQFPFSRVYEIGSTKPQNSKSEAYITDHYLVQLYIEAMLKCDEQLAAINCCMMGWDGWM